MSERSFKERYEQVLADTFGGLHNVPGKVKPFGDGVSVNVHRGLATYDFNNLTRLVLSAHKHCIRAEILPNMRYLKITLFSRERVHESTWGRHPSIEQAIGQFNDRPERQYLT